MSLIFKWKKNLPGINFRCNLFQLPSPKHIGLSILPAFLFQSKYFIAKEDSFIFIRPNWRSVNIFDDKFRIIKSYGRRFFCSHFWLIINGCFNLVFSESRLSPNLQEPWKIGARFYKRCIWPIWFWKCKTKILMLFTTNNKSLK